MVETSSVEGLKKNLDKCMEKGVTYKIVSESTPVVMDEENPYILDYKAFAENAETELPEAPVDAFVQFNFLEHQPDPRSMLGCIIAEADRDVEPETIVRRTVEYGLSHYPSLDLEGHWQRTLEHLHEKYAEGGYIKLWLPDSPNAAPLAELRALIRDEARLRAMFNEIIADRL